MENLNNVPNTGTFGNSVQKINSNFDLIVNAINSLEYKTTRSKGILNYGQNPATVFPNAVAGDWCMILSEGNVFPATIKTFNGSTWSGSGTWNPDGVDLTGYAKTTDMTTAIANSLAQATARMGYGECTVNGTSLVVSIPNFILPTSGGTIHIKMSSAGTGASTLSINGTTAKTLWYNGAAVSAQNTWEAGEIISVFYDGTRFMASNSQGGGSAVGKKKLNGTQGYYVNLSGETAPEPTSSGGGQYFSYIKYPVHEGDVVEIKGKSSSQTALVWGLIDSTNNNTIVERAPVGADYSQEPFVKVIPSGVDYIILNNYNREFADYEWYFAKKGSAAADAILGKYAEYTSFNNSKSGLAAGNVQDALDETNILEETEVFDITKAEANNPSSSNFSFVVDTENETVTVSTKIKINNDGIAGGLKCIGVLENGKTYKFSFDYTNNISGTKITIAGYNSGTLTVGSGHLSFKVVYNNTNLLISLPKNTAAGKSCILSNISIIEIDYLKDTVNSNKKRLDAIETDVSTFHNAVMSKPIVVNFGSMIQGAGMVSPSTKNWRSDNATYQHYWFERSPNMKEISIQGNGNVGSYISFVKTYNYTGTPTGTPDYCEGYTGPIGFVSSSIPQNTVEIPNDCNYIIINKGYNTTVQLPVAVYVTQSLKEVVAYKDNTISTYNIPMEVGLIATNTGLNSTHSGDAISANGYVYATTNGEFNYWRNVGLIEVGDEDYTLSFDKGNTCWIYFYNSLREFIKYTTHDIVEDIVFSPSGAKYIRIVVFTKSATYEQDGSRDIMAEPKISIKGLFSKGLKVSKLGRQATTQADTIVTPVWIEDVFSSENTTQELQDNGEWHIDFGRIAFPSNYNPDGEPVRLIIYSHGGAPRYNPVFKGDSDYTYGGDGNFESTMHINPTVFLKEGYAVMDMDACFCIFNTKAIDGIKIINGKQVANCYQAAYNFVVRNYNIKTDGVLIGGISFGGPRCMQMLMWSNIPILAAALHSPYVGEHKHWFIGHRRTLARHAGFTNYDNITIGNLDEGQLEILKENYPKLLRTSPMLAMCHPSKEEFFATKTIEINGQTVEVSLLNGYKNFGIYVVSTWAAHFPVPIKMWAGTADTTAQPDEHANVLYSVGINGGSDIELRTVQGAKHVPTVGSDIITIPTYVTKFGEVLNNVSMIYAETIRFWRRYEQ